MYLTGKLWPFWLFPDAELPFLYLFYMTFKIRNHIC